MGVKIILAGSQQKISKLNMYLRDDDFSIVSSVSNESEILDEIDRTSPDILLICDVTPMILRVCHQVYLLRPRTSAVVLADPQDEELKEKLLQSGVHHIIPLTADTESMAAELKNIYSSESSRLLALEL